MANNRFRNGNTVSVGSLAWWILISCFVGVAALGYVHLKNQIHAAGTKIKLLERELADLNTQDEVVRAKIASLSSRSVLQRRLEDGFIKLVPITDDRLVRLEGTVRGERGELRAVSNQNRTP
jgi:hypothetical protein